MKKIKVKSSRFDYDICIAPNAIEKLGALVKAKKFGRRAMIVTQVPVMKHAIKVEQSLKKSGFEVSILKIANGESAKSQKTLSSIYKALLKRKFERRDWLVAVGGGVVGDLSGFAAASFYRGLPLVQVPTTLLAQVDSSIGGKTGINLPEGKNLVGAFYPARLVLSDTNTLKTLPARELKASLAEVVKYGVIRSKKLFQYCEKNSKKLLRKDPSALAHIVTESARIKADVVSRDEYETGGQRMILNFGHTFGHGFEQVTNYKTFLHGEAVALGMVCAAYAGEKSSIFSGSETERVVNLLKQLQLPVSLKPWKLKAAKIYQAMGRDKKKKSGKIRYVLPEQIGRVVVDDKLSRSDVMSCLRELGGL